MLGPLLPPPLVIRPLIVVLGGLSLQIRPVLAARLIRVQLFLRERFLRDLTRVVVLRLILLKVGTIGTLLSDLR